MKQILFLLLITLSLNACSSTCEMPSEDSQPRNTIVTGYVYDAITNERVPRAIVSILGTDFVTMTNSQGKFYFSGLDIASHDFRVQKDNLGSGISQLIGVQAGDSVYTALPLTPVTGPWKLSITWEGRGTFGSNFDLRRDGTLKWDADGDGFWTLIDDSIHVRFANGTSLHGIADDSLSGVVDQASSPINGVFTAQR